MTCQQDVPGTAHVATGRIVCARCHQPAGKTPSLAASINDAGIALDEMTSASTTPPSPLGRNDWAHRCQVRALGRELRRPTATAAVPASFSAAGHHRLDPPQNLFSQLEHLTTAPVVPIAAQNSARRQRQPHSEISQLLAWLIIVAGAVSLGAGIGFIAWPLFQNRMMNWNLALSLTLGGQGALILGLVLAVSRLWRSSRHAANKLQDVQARLGKLQTTADALTGMRTGTASAFYADLARGASPQVLLANLKGQVDQLATHVSSDW
jgi:hypothetical protein